MQGEATGRAIKLAAWAGVPLYVVHVMSEDALAEVVTARVAGQRVYGETVTSALALTDRGLCVTPPAQGALLLSIAQPVVLWSLSTLSNVHQL